MKSEKRITLQRDWFWNRAVEFETLYGNTENEEHLATAEAFAMVAGTLDWVLADGDGMLADEEPDVG